MFKDLLIDIRDQGTTLSNYFKDKSLVSLEEIFTKFEEAVDELENLKEEFKDYKQYVEDNYRPLSQAELIGYNESDFYE